MKMSTIRKVQWERVAAGRLARRLVPTTDRRGSGLSGVERQRGVVAEPESAGKMWEARDQRRLKFGL